MLYLRQTLLGVACIALFGCAVGAAGELDPLTEFTPENALAYDLDAGSSSPQTPVIASPAPPIPSVTTPQTPVTQSVGAQGSVGATPQSSVLDASVASSAPVASSQDAALPTSTSGRDAGTASTSTRDASTAPVSAPMCSPLKCNNNCALLPRCCNEQNECACRSLFGTCSLPSL